MGLTVVAGDPLASGVGRAVETDSLTMGVTGTVTPGSAPSFVPQEAVKRWFDTFVGTTGGATKAAKVGELGRGTTDTDITYLVLKNASGVDCYIFPDSAGTAITVQTTRP